MSECVRRRLRRLIVEKNRCAGGFGLNRQSRDFQDRLELQTDLWSHAFADLELLLDRFVAIQSDRKLVRSEWDMSEGVWRYLWRLIIEHNGGAGRFGPDRNGRNFQNRLELQTNLRSHAFADLELLPDRFIAVESDRKLVHAERHMSEGVRRRLRRLIVEKNRCAGGFGLNRQSRDFQDRLELQTDLWSHAFADLELLLDRFVAIQSDRKLVRSEWDMSEGVWRYLWRLIIEHNGGAGRFGPDRNGRNFQNRLELQTNLRSHAFADLELLPDRFIAVESDRKLVHAERHMSEGVRRRLRRLIVEKNRCAGGFGLNRQSRDFQDRLELQTDLWSHAFADLELLLDRFVAIQSDRKLVRSEWDMSEGVWRYLWRLIIEHNGGAGRFGPDRNGRNFQNRLELQTNLRSHASVDLELLLDRFVALQSDRNLVRTERDMSEGIWRHLWRFVIEPNRCSGGARLYVKGRDVFNGCRRPEEVNAHCHEKDQDPAECDSQKPDDGFRPPFDWSTCGNFRQWRPAGGLGWNS